MADESVAIRMAAENFPQFVDVQTLATVNKCGTACNGAARYAEGDDG